MGSEIMQRIKWLRMWSFGGFLWTQQTFPFPRRREFLNELNDYHNNYVAVLNLLSKWNFKLSVWHNLYNLQFTSLVGLNG